MAFPVKPKIKPRGLPARPTRTDIVRQSGREAFDKLIAGAIAGAPKPSTSGGGKPVTRKPKLW